MRYGDDRVMENGLKKILQGLLWICRDYPAGWTFEGYIE